MSAASPLLLEIGTEELPSSFVDAALGSPTKFASGLHHPQDIIVDRTFGEEAQVVRTSLPVTTTASPYAGASQHTIESSPAQRSLVLH